MGKAYSTDFESSSANPLKMGDTRTSLFCDMRE